MKFYSLNKQSSLASFKEATILGQAPDKGLFFPEHIPVFSENFFSEIENIPDDDQQALKDSDSSEQIDFQDK